MDKFEGSGSMQLTRAPVCAGLPEEVVKIQSTRQALPSPTPRGQVIVFGLDFERLFLDMGIDGEPVVAARDYCDVMPLIDQSKHPVPANCGFRTFVGFARVSRKKDLHVRERCA